MFALLQVCKYCSLLTTAPLPLLCNFLFFLQLISSFYLYSSLRSYHYVLLKLSLRMIKHSKCYPLVKWIKRSFPGFSRALASTRFSLHPLVPLPHFLLLLSWIGSLISRTPCLLLCFIPSFGKASPSEVSWEKEEGRSSHYEESHFSFLRISLHCNLLQGRGCGLFFF